MTPARYDVVFRGKILPGFDSEDVKSKLMDLFSIYRINLHQLAACLKPVTI